MYGREGVALVEGVAQFKYPWNPTDQMYDNWPAVLRNVKQARKIWGRLGKMLQKEGTDIKVLEIFYRAVVQKVILLGLEYWFLSSAMEKWWKRHTPVYCAKSWGCRSGGTWEGCG